MAFQVHGWSELPEDRMIQILLTGLVLQKLMVLGTQTGKAYLKAFSTIPTPCILLRTLCRLYLTWAT